MVLLRLSTLRLAALSGSRPANGIFVKDIWLSPMVSNSVRPSSGAGYCGPVHASRADPLLYRDPKLGVREVGISSYCCNHFPGQR
jgi:hypothetical protein